MATINATQEKEVTFLSGVTSSGAIAATSFWSWNSDSPATYGTTSDESKWGTATAGAGATISYAFDAASNFTSAEKAAFVAAMHLWSEVANISFVASSTTYGHVMVISRASDGTSTGGSDLRPGVEGSHTLGTATSGSISIDTSVYGFGPVSGALTTAGGYPFMTMAHEIGHVLGLGHAGAYDDGTSTTSPQLTAYDSRAWSIMSYNDETASNGSAAAVDGSFNYGNNNPTTPMMLDILAVQRLYGVATSGPLQGGQVFGFHSNIQGDTAKYFDFTVDTKPVVTLWDGGTGNTLDLSGYTTNSTVDLHAGAFSSVAGMSNNIGIAYDTRIDALVLGGGADKAVGNDDGDYLSGGAGADTLTGGAGNDHIYGNAMTTTQGATDGADVIDAGGGSNYVNGNAGADTITAGNGSNRLYGGADNDSITAGDGNNSVNGNVGDDRITLGNGNNVAHGGQGSDTISVGNGNNQIFGDVGNDYLAVGTGIDTLTGGAGSDVFAFHNGDARWQGSDTLDDILDFTHGADQIALGYKVSAVLHGTGYASAGAAEAAAQSLLGATSAVGEVAALQVGSDTLLFYNGAGTSEAVDSALRLTGVGASVLSTSDFTTATSHL